MTRKDKWLLNLDRQLLLDCVLGEWSKRRADKKRRERSPAIQEPPKALYIWQCSGVEKCMHMDTFMLLALFCAFLLGMTAGAWLNEK